MDFLVYDNIHTYNKMHPSKHHYPETDILIKQVIITSWNSFWIETDFEPKNPPTVNINKPYVHIHKKIKNTKMNFDIEPHYIDMESVVYDPKKRRILIYKPNSISWNPWRKPLKIKGVRNNYYGSKLPLKSQKASSTWKYNVSTNQVHIILNYYGGTQDQKYTSVD